MRSLVRCCLVAALAWLVPGQTVHGAESPAPLSVGAADRIVVGPQMEVLFDPAGALDLAGARAAHAAGRFGASPSAVPAFGFHPGAVWLRFAVVNPGPAHEERWLELGWPLLQSAELSLVGQDGRVQVFQNGARVPVQDRPVASRQLLFPIALAPQETATAYLRLSSRSSLVADLALWRPAAYADARELRMAVKYLAGGATLIVVVYSVLAWRARRRPALLGAGAAQLCLLAIGLTLEGIPGGWLAGATACGRGRWSTRCRS